MDKEEVIRIIGEKRPDKFTTTTIEASIDEVEQEIINYCQITEVPDALRFTVANMSIDLLEYETEVNKVASAADLESIDLADVSSIRVGDTAVNIGEGRSANVRKSRLNRHKSNLDDVVMNYRAQLNRFRRLW